MTLEEENRLLKLKLEHLQKNYATLKQKHRQVLNLLRDLQNSFTFLSVAAHNCRVAQQREKTALAKGLADIQEASLKASQKSQRLGDCLHNDISNL